MTQEGKPSRPAAVHAGLIFVPCSMRQSSRPGPRAPPGPPAASARPAQSPPRWQMLPCPVPPAAHTANKRAGQPRAPHLVVALRVALHVGQVLLGGRPKLCLLLLAVAAPEGAVHLCASRLQPASQLDRLRAALGRDPGFLRAHEGGDTPSRSPGACSDSIPLHPPGQLTLAYCTAWGTMTLHRAAPAAGPDSGSLHPAGHASRQAALPACWTPTALCCWRRCKLQARAAHRQLSLRRGSRPAGWQLQAARNAPDMGCPGLPLHQGPRHRPRQRTRTRRRPARQRLTALRRLVGPCSGNQGVARLHSSLSCALHSWQPRQAGLVLGDRQQASGAAGCQQSASQAVREALAWRSAPAGRSQGWRLRWQPSPGTRHTRPRGTAWPGCTCAARPTMRATPRRPQEHRSVHPRMTSLPAQPPHMRACMPAAELRPKESSPCQSPSRGAHTR